MTTDWYQKSINALQLNGKGERTQEAYTRAVPMLSAFYDKPPEQISEAELEAYFLYRRNVDHWSANTMRICYCDTLVRWYRSNQDPERRPAYLVCLPRSCPRRRYAVVLEWLCG